MRDKPFPIFERLGNIFGKDRATGETARTPAELMEEAQEDNHEDDQDMDGVSSITPTPINQIPSAQQSLPTKRKRAKKEDSITSGFKSIFASMQQYLDQSAQRMDKISHSMMVANKHEVRDIHQEGRDMAEELDRMGFSSFLKIKILKLIVRKQENVVVFNSLTGEDRKLFVNQLLEESSPED